MTKLGYRLLQDSVLLGFGLCLIALTLMAIRVERFTTLPEAGPTPELSHVQPAD
ncbi:MAG: hypothetical protein AAFQ61_07300 [Cyanobacteria bacterium J06626_23]